MIQALRFYIPLIGFVVPTAAIGYGVVLPRSGICGVNELTVGFGTTILGAALTYVAGIRMARRTSCPARAPWRRRLAQYINRQAAAPHGLFGRLLGVIWSVEHRKLNRRTLDLLEIEPQHSVLEIGCGPGTALREASRRAENGYVAGVDISETMVSIASRKNRATIAAGRASVRRVDGVDLEIDAGSFDRLYSVHSIYFWRDPEHILAQLARGLRPGGRVVIAFRPDDADLPSRFRDPTYRFYTTSEVEEMMMRSGFKDVRTVQDPVHPNVVFLVAGRDASASS